MSEIPTHGPEAMRAAMAGYVRAVHEAYEAQLALQAPAIRGRMALGTGEPFTVIAAGVQNLHVIATRETLATPRGPEVEMEEELGSLRWTLRFYDPVVLPALGLVDESKGPAGEQVRRALGIATYLYHLVVQPGAELSDHQATHAGAGLASAHAAASRDFEEIRARAGAARLPLVDEMEGAEVAGLPRAHGLLAAEIAPWSEELTGANGMGEVRRALLEALRDR